MKQLAEHDLRWTRIAWWAIWGVSLYRLGVLLWGDIPLDVEEAYYLSWARHLEAGYFSKPPLLTWTLAGATALFGDSLPVIKSVAVLFHAAAALFVFGIGRRLFDARTGAWAAIAFQSLPIVGVLSVFASTDAPLMCFWAASLYGVVRALERDALRWWLFTGLMAGLGLLSKYTIGALAVGLALALFADPRGRACLRSPRLWAGLGLAVLVWSPNLWWLATHGFVTLDHTRHITLEIPRAGGWGNLGEFLLGQAGAFGPLFALSLPLWIGRRALWRDPRTRLLLLASLPLLLLVSHQAWRHEANLNWAAPAWIGLTLVAVHWLLIHARRWLTAAVALNLLLVAGLYHYHALADVFDVQLTRKTDPYFKRLGWRELGQQLVAIRRRHPQAPLLSDSRKLLALLGYHARLDGQPPVLRSWNPHRRWRHQYDLYDDLADHPGDAGEYLFVSRTALDPSVLARFDESALLAILRVGVYPDLVRRLYVYRVSGFRGYASP